MKRQIFALCMVLGLAMASVVLADAAHPNRTARDQAYLSSGTLLPNSTGNAGATITKGGVISTSGNQPASQPMDTTAPTGQDPLHPNRTTRDQAYLSSGGLLANSTTGNPTITRGGVISGDTTDDNRSSNTSTSGSSDTSTSGSSNMGASGSSGSGASGSSNTDASGSSGSRPLPRTASDLPLLGLLGALALAGALALRANR